MKFLGLVLFVVAALVAAGCVDYAKAPSAKASSQEPTQVIPDECVENIDCPAGNTCDQGECVVSKPEPTPGPDTVQGEPDTTPEPEADTATGNADVAPTPGPDTASSPDSSPSVGEDGGEGDTVAPKPDVEVPQPDTEVPGPDTVQPSPDTETPSPDVETSSPDVEQGGEDAIAPSPDTNQPQADTSPQPSPQGGEGDADASSDSSPAGGEDEGEGDASGASSDAALESETTEESDAGEPPCVPVDEVCGNAVDEDCDGEDVPCPPTVVDKVSITVEDSESTALSLQTDITSQGPYGWETIQDTEAPFGWELEIGSSDSVSELYRLNIFREPDGDWLCNVPFAGEPTCLVLPTLSVDGETVVVESYTDRVIIPAGVAAVMADPKYPDGNVANIGICWGLASCEVACDNGLDDDNDGLVDLDDPHCN